MLWWFLGGILVCGGFILLWVAMEKQVMRTWRRRQRLHLQEYLRRNPEAGELQMDGSFCYRRGPHVIRYLHHPDTPPPNHVVWLTIKQRVSEWDRPSRHTRRWLRTVALGWTAHLWHWQTGAVVIAVLAVGIGLGDTERARQARLSATVASALGVPAVSVRLERGGDSMITELQRAMPATERSRVWSLTRPRSYVLLVEGRDVGYVWAQGRLNLHAEVWLRKDDRWRRGIMEGSQVTWQP